jgi:Alanine dehydrogenase
MWSTRPAWAPALPIGNTNKLEHASFTQPEEIYGRADVLLKIAPPFASRNGDAASRFDADGIAPSGSSAPRIKLNCFWSMKSPPIAYEQNSRPRWLPAGTAPFSQIGGSMAAQVAARLLQNNEGGKGILLGGIPGVPPAEIVIIGAGVVGTCAARAFLGMGAHVTVLDRDLWALQRITERFPTAVTMLSTPRNIEKVVQYADVVVGAVLVPGERAPILITREMVRKMKPRSVILDISIDQGGCVETSHPTTHERPTFIEEGVIHYCVPNMPGVVARTATHAFVNAVMSYLMEIAQHGVEGAIARNPGLEAALNTHQGRLVHLSRLKGLEGKDELD